MAKITNRINIRVELYPKVYMHSLTNEAQEILDAEHIVSQIKRHVDDVADINVIWDTEDVCSLCGYGWELNENPNDPDWAMGEPTCCVEAQEAWKKEKHGY